MSKELHRVVFEPSGQSIEVEAGVTLKEAAALAGAVLETPCGGLGTCGRCTVTVTGLLEQPTDDELVLLGEAALAEGVRLACRARVAGDVTVSPREPVRHASLKIVEVGTVGEVAVEPPGERGIHGPAPLLGAVVDIGTTTVVAVVVDLESGERLGSSSALNPQHSFGHDVMSRISHASTSGVESLRRPIAEAIETLVLHVLETRGAVVEHLREVAIAGNTTMIHLLLGIDPGPLGVTPYEPAFVERVERPAAEIGLPGLTNARAYVLPGVSAFIGADITAGLVATGVAEQQRPVLFLDLGTNGEMVLRTPDGLVGASTAAGPALEGASVAYGMRAEDGAIERVSLDGDELRIETIGGAVARGICGSGLLDLVAVLLDTGLLDHTGRLRDDVAHPLVERVSELEDTRAFEVAAGVYLTQRDVRQVQLANAAIASGIEMLLAQAGVLAEEVEQFVVAGGFGYHVKAAALVRMGMIPQAWADRLSFAGNTALAGGLMALLDSETRRRAEAIARHVQTVDLAAMPDFQTRFIRAMTFPAY